MLVYCWLALRAWAWQADDASVNVDQADPFCDIIACRVLCPEDVVVVKE